MTVRANQLRAARIALIARIAFGRDPKDQYLPVHGWQSKLSRAMGLGRTAVHDTMKTGHGAVFDRKLREYAITLQERLERDRDELEYLFKTLAAEGDDE